MLNSLTVWSIMGRCGFNFLSVIVFVEACVVVFFELMTYVMKHNFHISYVFNVSIRPKYVFLVCCFNDGSCAAISIYP